MNDNKQSQPSVPDGLGMPAPTRRHQFLVGQIHANFIDKYRRFRHNILLGVDVIGLPDHERIPDISIWDSPYDADDEASPNLLLSIEITHTTQNDAYSEASICETFALLPSLRESFIYNYETDTWTRFRRTDNGIEKHAGKDFSCVLECYLHTLLG